MKNENTNDNVLQRIAEFKIKCTVYFQEKSLKDLRAYGRYVGLQRPTALSKKDLIDTIVKTLCGETLPARNSKGAPVKSYHLDPSIFTDIDALKREYGIEHDLRSFTDHPVATETAATPTTATAQSTKKATPQFLENEALSVQIVLNFSNLSKKQKEKLSEFFHSL